MRFKKKKKIKLKVKILLSIAVVIGLIYLFFYSGIFTIKSVDVSSQQITCVDSNQIKKASNILGQNFFFINQNLIEKTLKNKFICIKNINLSRRFPSKVKLEVLPRMPVVVLTNLNESPATQSALLENISTPSAEISQDSFLVDEQGVIFAKDEGSSGAPKIYINNQNISLGGEISNLPLSLKILQKLKTFQLNVISSRIIDNFLVIFETNIKKIIFRLDDRVDIQIASLQLILEKAKIDSKELEFIDLRFDKPIVRYTTKEKI